jgi:hypothetical protein
MSFSTTLDTALYQRLTTTSGTTLWHTRVYAHQAPQGAALPYVIFKPTAGGDLNLSPSRLVECRYEIECIADTLAEARQGTDYLDTALHEQPLTVSGWNHLGTTGLGLVSRVDNLDGRQYWRRGGSFRIRLSK